MSRAAWVRELRVMLEVEDPQARLSATRSGHVVVILSNGVRVFAAGTPGDVRALLNTRGDVRRALRRRANR